MPSTLLKVFSCALICIFVQYSQSHEFPKGFVRCHPTDNDCVLKQFNELVKTRPQGYPEIFLEKLDPFPIGDIKILGDPATQANINLELTQVKLHGYSNSTFTKITGFTNDPEDIKADFESVYPKLIIEGKYKISGKVLILPITGEGDFVFTVKNLLSKARLLPLIEVRDGKVYLKAGVYKVKTKPDGLDIQMENLFNNNKEIGKNMLKVLNENWKLMWDTVEPEFTKQVIKANTRVIDAVTSKIPYNELFIID